MHGFWFEASAAAVGTIMSAIVLSGGAVAFGWLRRRRRKRWLLYRNAGAWSLRWRGPGIARDVSWASIRTTDPLNYLPVGVSMNPGDAVGLEGEVKRDAGFWIQWTDRHRWFAAFELPATGDRFKIGPGEKTLY